MREFNFLLSLLLTSTQFVLSQSQCPFGSEREQNLYKKLCFDPTGLASRSFTIEKFGVKAPSDGWFVHFGNTIGRFHLASVLKGKRMRHRDRYEDMCYTIEKAYTYQGTTAIGHFNGFGRPHAAYWYCKPSLDFSGIYRCNLRNSHIRYRDDIYFYYTETEVKDLYLSVMCFPNAEIGWLTLSNKNDLTKEDHQAVQNKVASLGFQATNFVKLYDSNCNNTGSLPSNEWEEREDKYNGE